VIPVFVDTSGFVALADRRDEHHGEAKRLLRRLSARRIALVTSTDVLDEVVTLIRVRVGHPAAVTIGQRLLASQWCRLVEVDETIRRAGWDLFVRFADQEFSFTDCTSLALMRSMHLSEAFTFDRRDFTTAGFVPRP
jgi:predicted nucleic acid-binding protein